MQISELKQLCHDLTEQREKLDDMKANLSHEQVKYDVLKDKIIRILKDNDLKSFVSDNIKVTKTEKFNVSIVDENEFSEYLKQHELDHLRKVPYQTLQSFYKEEMEKAVQRGDGEMEIPGVSVKSTFESLQIRKA